MAIKDEAVRVTGVNLIVNFRSVKHDFLSFHFTFLANKRKIKMKFFIVFATCLFAIVSAGEDLNSKRAAILEKCKKELSLSDEVASVANVKREAKTEQEKCFLQCVYENMGLIKDGKLNAEGAEAVSRSKFGDDPKKLAASKAVFEKCQKDYVPSSEKCFMGGHIRKCLVNNESNELKFFN